MDTADMVNERFTPSENCEKVLDVLKDGRANPRYIINQTDMEKTTVEYCLRRLVDADWITKPARGLYEFNTDPRENQE